MTYTPAMRTRTPMRVLLTIALMLALLPMLSTFAPGGQVAGFTTASPAMADQVWYQSVGRASATAACEKSTTTELAAGWTNWAPSWAKWVNGGKGGFVCNRQITWAYDTPPVSCATGGGAAGTCIVGNTGPGGGIVFYVNEANATGSRYLEAALSGWNTGADPALEWGVNTGGVDCSTLNIAGAVGTAIGTGLANTTAITTACTAAQAPAAWAARNYTGGGLATGSWFLPSQLELNQLCRYASSQVFDAAATTCTGSSTPIGGFAADPYWSSSQDAANRAWSQNFDIGIQFNVFKFNALDVRPVRAF
jgi:hypothetical protein